VGTPVGKRPLGRPLSGWKDIKMDLKSVRKTWIDLAQNRAKWWALLNAVPNLQYS
jgi:hypothetical protein